MTVDLRNNVLTATWESVEVDANVSADPPGLTSIGPEFHGGSHKGVVYLEMNRYAQLRSTGKLASWPPPTDHLYQYQNVVRPRADGGLDRFHGFAAEVLEVSGTVSRIAVYGVGAAEPQKTLWLDLADPGTCDPPARQLTTITAAKGSHGALFLSWDLIGSESLAIPKLPRGDGSGSLPDRTA